MKTKLTACLLIGLAYAGSASALSITPVAPLPSCTSDNPGGTDADFLSSSCGAGDLSLAYKENSPSGEEGTLATSYSTSFVTEAVGDYVGATVSWDGPGALLCTAANPCWLVVKGGNSSPARYGYNLTGVWDGLEDLVVSGFWSSPTRGSISHIALFGGICSTNCDDRDVPEPGTLALLGLGLLGLGMSRRRKA